MLAVLEVVVVAVVLGKEVELVVRCEHPALGRKTTSLLSLGETALMDQSDIGQ